MISIGKANVLRVSILRYLTSEWKMIEMVNHAIKFLRGAVPSDHVHIPIMGAMISRRTSYRTISAEPPIISATRGNFIFSVTDDVAYTSIAQFSPIMTGVSSILYPRVSPYE